ncbi:MAG TPA: EVE domain-containing protein [Thermoanaerobaculia bacterium]|nr:EVE domain-containing protein [Thermoanaerobaculia bacterium]
MRYWLIKSEPETYSFADLQAEPDRTTCWNGVRNYGARNHMREMKVGDQVLFYHSSTEPPHVAGVARVVREAYPDATAWDRGSPYHDPKATPEAPRWQMVDVQADRALPAPVTLAELKANPELAGMAVVQRGQRLSVQPVTAGEFAEVLRMAEQKARRR